jgi:hypothetical protein
LNGSLFEVDDPTTKDEGRTMTQHQRQVKTVPKGLQVGMQPTTQDLSRLLDGAPRKEYPMQQLHKAEDLLL